MLTDAKTQISRNTRIAIGLWVLVVCVSLWWNFYNAQEQMLATVRIQTTDSNDMALCEVIIVMAHKLELQVVSEGTETGEQRNFPFRAGGDFAQDYLFSRTVPQENFERLLTDAGSADQLAGV